MQVEVHLLQSLGPLWSLTVQGQSNHLGTYLKCVMSGPHPRPTESESTFLQYPQGTLRSTARTV